MSKLTISSFIKTLMPVLNQDNNQEKAFRLLFDPIYGMIEYVDLDKRNSNKELIAGKIYKLTAICSLESAFVHGNYMTNVEFEYAGIKYKAATSCNNWLSQSKMDNILNAGSSTLTLIFDVLNKDNGTAHIYLIGELNK